MGLGIAQNGEGEGSLVPFPVAVTNFLRTAILSRSSLCWLSVWEYSPWRREPVSCECCQKLGWCEWGELISLHSVKKQGLMTATARVIGSYFLLMPSATPVGGRMFPMSKVGPTSSVKHFRKHLQRHAQWPVSLKLLMPVKLSLKVNYHWTFSWQDCLILCICGPCFFAISGANLKTTVQVPSSHIVV